MTVIEIDSGHDVMVSRPAELARVLNPIVERALRAKSP